MSNRVNYIYSTDYKGYQIPQGISLSGSKTQNNAGFAQQPANQGVSQSVNINQQMSQAQTFSYQPASKENVASNGAVPVSPYLQHLSYSTQSGRTVQRTASPMIIQHPRYQTASNTQQANKYSVPSYQQNGSLSSSVSAEKNDPLTRSLLGNQLSQQQTNGFNNSQALRSPYVSSFTSSTNSSQIQSANQRSSNTYSSAYTSIPQIAQSLVLTKGNSSTATTTPQQQSTATSQMNQSVPTSTINGTGSNTNSSINSTSFSAVYTSLSANKQLSNSSGLYSQNEETSGQRQENGQLRSQNIAYSHTRCLSTNTPQRLENYYQQQQQSPRSYVTGQDSLSPSKRVTFNLARNTYTDIEQIEKRLSESTKLRPAEEVEDSRDRTPTATFQVAGVYEENDLNKRFDQAIYRSERIISDCLRIGREGIQYRNQLENSVATNGSTTPVGPKMVRNPSRSKSPIKSSLKRTSSFTGSPQKLSNSENQQFSDAFKNPLQNQTNKVINNTTTATNSSEIDYLGKQNNSILQSSSALENSNKASTIQSTSTQQYNTSFSTDPQNLNGQLNEKSAAQSSTSYLSTSASQQKQGENNYRAYDENQYVSTSQTGARSATPIKQLSANQNSSITQAYNTTTPNLQRASFLTRSQTKENDPILSSMSQTKTQNENNVELLLLKKTESVMSNTDTQAQKEEKQKENGQYSNEQKRYTLQYTPPVKPRQGILRYSDGSRYDGEIVNSQRHGYGTLLSSEFQVIYQGDWQNDTYHGQGKFFNPLAENLFDEYDYNDFDIALSQFWESYEGEFYEGKLDGFGTLMLTNGEKLVGNFKKGRISGKGTFYCNKGPALTGNWEDNRLIEKY